MLAFVKEKEEEEEEETLEDLSEVDATFEDAVLVCCEVFEVEVDELELTTVPTVGFEVLENSEVVERVDEEEVLVVLPEDDIVDDLMEDEDFDIVVLVMVEEIVLIEDAGANGPPIVIARSIGFGSESRPESLIAPSGVTSS